MAQTVRFIKIDQSYVPVDPDAFPVNLFDESRTEQISDPKAIVAYDGFNFLPTAYGYQSYFGTDYSVNVDALPSRVDFTRVFQGIDFTTLNLAFCEDGLYMALSATETSWHKVIDSPRDSDKFYPWFAILVGNDLWCWRRGDVFISVIRYNPLSDYEYTDQDAVDFTIAFHPTTDWAGTGDRSRIRYGVGFEKTTDFGTLPSEWFINEAEVGPLTEKALQYTWTLPAGDDYTGKARLFRWVGDDVNEGYSFVEFAAPTDPVLETYTFVDVDGSEFMAFDNYPGEAWAVPATLQLYAPKRLDPTFINMAGQEGMFSAGMRLGFWDTEDAIATSSLDDFADFVPSLATLASTVKYADVKGTIVTIQPMLDGFIVYSTGSIVHIRKDVNSTNLWVPQKLSDFGIAYPRQVVKGQSVNVHYAITQVGIYEITPSEMKQIVPEFFDVIRTRTQPTYLDLLQDRYLAFLALDDTLEYRNVRTMVNSAEWACPLIDPQDYYHMDLVEPVAQELITDAWMLLPCILKAQYDRCNKYSPFLQRYSRPLWYKRFNRSLLRSAAELSVLPFDTSTSNLIIAEDGTYVNWKPMDLTVEYGNEWFATDMSGVQADVNAPTQFILQQIALWAYADEQGRQDAEAALHNRVVYECFVDNPRDPVPDYTIPTNQAVPWEWHPLQLQINFMEFKCARRIKKQRLIEVVVHEERAGSDLRSVYTLRLAEPSTPTDEYGAWGIGGLRCVGWEDTTTWDTELRPLGDGFNWDGEYRQGVEHYIGGRYGEFNRVFFNELTVEYGANEWLDPPLENVQQFITWTPNVRPGNVPPESDYITMQDGTPEPAYPLYRGAFLYDMNLKKWGKHAGDHYGYVNFQAVNQPVDSTVPYPAFLGKAGLIATDRSIRIFNNKPADSEICYGKIGYSRLGFTELEEVIAHFRVPCSGSLAVECSIDGRHPEEFLGQSVTFVDATKVSLFANFSARWYNVVIKGNYDLTYLEFRGQRAGRR